MYNTINMYEVVDFLCRKNHISIAQMCRDIGMRQSIITDLKHGRTKNLSHANMVKIANYFQVSTDVFSEGVLEETMPNENDAKAIAGYHYLLDVPKKETPALTKKDERDIEKILAEARRQLEDNEGLMFDGDPASPEAIESILTAMELGLQAAKMKNKEKYTPKKYRK